MPTEPSFEYKPYNSMQGPRRTSLQATEHISVGEPLQAADPANDKQDSQTSKHIWQGDVQPLFET